MKIADAHVEKMIQGIVQPLCDCVGDTDDVHFSLHEEAKKDNIPLVSKGGVVFHRCMQMAATMGLVPAKHVTCGRVHGHGPLSFCKKFLGKHTTLSEASDYFDQLHADLKSNDSNFLKSNLEQVMCSEGRKHRKVDVIYEDPKTGLPQNFFLAKSKTKSNVQMRVLHRGRWEQLSHVFHPFFKMSSKNKNTNMTLFPRSKSWITSHLDDCGELSRLPQTMWEMS